VLRLARRLGRRVDQRVERVEAAAERLACRRRRHRAAALPAGDALRAGRGGLEHAREGGGLVLGHDLGQPRQEGELELDLLLLQPRDLLHRGAAAHRASHACEYLGAAREEAAALLLPLGRRLALRVLAAATLPTPFCEQLVGAHRHKLLLDLGGQPLLLFAVCLGRLEHALHSRRVQPEGGELGPELPRQRLARALAFGGGGRHRRLSQRVLEGGELLVELLDLEILLGLSSHSESFGERRRQHWRIIRSIRGGAGAGRDHGDCSGAQHARRDTPRDDGLGEVQAELVDLTTAQPGCLRCSGKQRRCLISACLERGRQRSGGGSGGGEYGTARKAWLRRKPERAGEAEQRERKRIAQREHL